MKIEKFNVQACCGRTSIFFKISEPISNSLLQYLKLNGYRETEHFTKAGILYADNEDFLITGPMGTDKLQVRCKKDNCDQIIDKFENFLNSINLSNNTLK